MSKDTTLPPQPPAHQKPLSEDEELALSAEEEEAVSRLTPRQSYRLDRMAQALTARELGTQELGFCASELAHCGLPLKRPKETAFERQDGYLTLRIEGSQRYGLPFGQDRLFLLFLTTAFHAIGMPRDNRIWIRHCQDIPALFGLPVDGHEMGLFKERIQRVCHTRFISEERNPQTGQYRARFAQLVDAFDLSFLKEGANHERSKWRNCIILNEHFANAQRERCVPIDLDTVRALKEHAAALDLYLLQARRSYLLKQQGKAEARLPVFGPTGLVWQLGTQTQDPRKLKQLLRRWQHLVRTHWFHCPNELSPDAEWFLIRPGEAISPNAAVSLREIVRSTDHLPAEYQQLAAKARAKPPSSGRIRFSLPKGDDDDGVPF